MFGLGREFYIADGGHKGAIDFGLTSHVIASRPPATLRTASVHIMAKDTKLQLKHYMDLPRFTLLSRVKRAIWGFGVSHSAADAACDGIWPGSDLP